MFAVGKYGHLEVTACASIACGFVLFSAESMKHPGVTPCPELPPFILLLMTPVLLSSQIHPLKWKHLSNKNDAFLESQWCPD